MINGLLSCFIFLSLHVYDEPVQILKFKIKTDMVRKENNINDFIHKGRFDDQISDTLFLNESDWQNKT